MDETSPGAPAADATASSESPVRTAIEITVRLGVIALIVLWCLQIVAPFIGIVIWAMIIAVAVDAPFDRLCDWMGGRRRTAAVAAVSVVLVIIAVPMIMLSETMVSGAQRFSKSLAAGELHVPPPPPEVAEWPLVGEPIHEFWKLGSENLKAALTRVGPQLEAISKWLLRAAGSVGAGLLQLIASLLIAGFMLARSEGRRRAIEHFASRLAGPERGPEFANLAYATIQSVVNGIVGIALIQSLLAGLGFILSGIPGAGLFALLVLVAAIIQFPVIVVMILPIALAFSTLETGPASFLTAWCIFVSLIDNFLKPLLLGRGVQVPMVVIFLGAIGGMLSMGIVGLFMGAVVLALGYELFMAWLGPATDASEGEAAATP